MSTSGHREMDMANVCDHKLHLEETELRLGLPGTKDSDIAATNLRTNKRALLSEDANSFCSSQKTSDQDCSPAAKAQIVGWPPVRSYRKNHLQPKKIEAEGIYVKVSMDGAPYLRKVDLNIYKGYTEFLKGLEEMFKFTIGQFSGRELFNNGSEFVPTYEDKDGDWMLVGDVPWDMFISSCKRLRIMKGSEASGLACAATV